MVTTGDFTIKSLKEQRQMTLEELRFYHQEILKNQNKLNNISHLLKIEKRMVFLTKIILKLDALSQKRALRIIKNRSYSTNKSIIYLFTTAGTYDVESAIEIASGASLVNVSNQQSIIPKIESLLLMTNRLLQTDGSLTKDEITELRLKNLALGNHDISFPELYPNKYPFVPVNELDPDIATLILNSDSTVIPVALEQYKEGNKTRCIANIGENFNLSGLNPNHVDDILKIIYNELTRLKEEIWLNISLDNFKSQMAGDNFENLLNYQDLKQNRLIKNK